MSLFKLEIRGQIVIFDGFVFNQYCGGCMAVLFCRIMIMARVAEVGEISGRIAYHYCL